MKTNYDYYLEGFWNAQQFAFIPEFENKTQLAAYCMGSTDGRNGVKKTIEEFELI